MFTMGKKFEQCDRTALSRAGPFAAQHTVKNKPAAQGRLWHQGHVYYKLTNYQITVVLDLPCDVARFSSIPACTFICVISSTQSTWSLRNYLLIQYTINLECD